MFTGKKMLILGMARSGYEVAKILKKRNNDLIINDMKKEQDPAHVKELEDLGIEVVLGSHPDNLLDSSVDYLIKNPGVPIDHKYVLKAKELGIPVINEAEIASLIFPEVHLIGITGTNGKTTTTTLIYEILKAKYKERVHLAGNIGYPVIALLPELKENDYVVMEVSVQQLENFDKFHPEVAVLTNIDEAHIDFMKTYEHYKENKKKIFKNMKSDELAVINLDNKEAFDLTKDIKPKKAYFSKRDKKATCFIQEDDIYYEKERIMDVDEMILKGYHNFENVMGAIIVAKHYGVETDIIRNVLKSFKGVEHRLEYVKEIEGVKFYNDSKATNIKSTQIALNTFNSPTILLLGGMERGQRFEDLKPYLKATKIIIGMAATRERIKKIFKDKEVYTYEWLKDAFKKAWDLSERGDIILLSPASASWGQYEKFEDRGDEFKKLVEGIDKKC